MKRSNSNPYLKILKEDLSDTLAKAALITKSTADGLHKGLTDTGNSASNQQAVNNAVTKSVANNDKSWVSENPMKSLYLGSMITGVGSKMIKDIEIVNHIIGKYPDPMDLKARLQKINHISAKMLAARLNEDTSYEEYKALIRKYICKSGFGKYLLHAIFGPISTIVNTLQAVGVPFNTPDDNIGDNI